MSAWPQSPAFFFALGDLLLDWAIRNPEQAAQEILPVVEQECTGDGLDVWRRGLEKAISEACGWLFGLPFGECLANILHLFVLEGASDLVTEVFAATAGDKILTRRLDQLMEQGVVGG